MSATETRFKAWVRRWMPSLLWVFLRRSATYLSRLRYWLRVVSEVRGDGPGEEAKLLASAIAAPVTAFGDFDRWRNPVLLFATRVRVASVDRFQCLPRTDDLHHVVPSGQRAVREALIRQLSAGGVFVDVGANIGAFTVPGARQVGPDGTVIAVEMMPATAQRLRSHLELNGLSDVRVVEGALNDRAGDIVIARQPEGLTGQASIAHDPGEGVEVIEHKIATLTLDDVVDGIARIDVLKIDVEGAEANVLAGATAALARTECLIFEEWGTSASEPSAARRLAEAAGFDLHPLDGNNLIGFRGGRRA